MTQTDEALRYLTLDEGDTVTVLSENPDAYTKADSRVVECFGAWTNYQPLRFSGETIPAAIIAAHTARGKTGL